MFPQLKEVTQQVRPQAQSERDLSEDLVVVDKEMTPESLIKLVMEEGQEISFAGMTVFKVSEN